MPVDEISVVDPRSPEVQAVLARHHGHVSLHTAPEDIHALDVDGLAVPSVTVFGLSRDGALLGIGAIKDLGNHHGELKSMHTLAEARGTGVAAALVDHMVAVARERGLQRLSLETGASDAFAPAHALYASRDFEPCGPFDEYVPSRNSRFMTRTL